MDLAIIDLDDTLIDTTGVLVPDALRRVAAAIRRPVEALDARGKTVADILGDIEGLSDTDREAAARAWYDPVLPPLELLPGAEALLSLPIRRALLTRGNRARQDAKIDALGLRGRFDAIVIRDSEGPGSKRDDIEALMERFRASPGTTAVIGDDPDDELRHGRDLGCHTIRVPDIPLTAIAERLKSRLPERE